jgi:HEAT repeat protein
MTGRFRVGAGLLILCAVAFAAGCGEESKPLEGPHGMGGEGPAAVQTPPSTALPSAVTGAVMDALIAKLSLESWEERDGAVREIIKLGAGAVPALSGRLGNAEALEAVELLTCLDLIGAGGREQVTALLAKTRDFDVTVFALRALGSLGDASTVAVLKPYLSWEVTGKKTDASFFEVKMDVCREGKVRNQAAESMVRLGETAAMLPLIRALRGNGWVRRDAIVSLRRLTGCRVDFGFTLDGGLLEREKAVKKWEAWWEGNAASFHPAFTRSMDVFDIFAVRK